MSYARLIVTAAVSYWLAMAAGEFCGYGTSVIACDAECGVDEPVEASLTPDGRGGVALMAYGFSPEQLAKSVANRVGQCLMTCPTTAVFNGHPSTDRAPLGDRLRYFGDGFQKSKKLGERRFWRIPVMDGEFVVEDTIGIGSGVAGGNFIIQSSDLASALAAARTAVAAISNVPGCITPFPGGIARSGSKVGSRYQNLKASTAEAFCPSLRGRVESKLHDNAGAAYEIVIDGRDERTVRTAMRNGIHAALNSESGAAILAISAGNYGGKLGKYQIPLRSLFDG